jgi:hypothetical protein
MALLKAVLKSALLPLRKAGGRFFIPPPQPPSPSPLPQDTIIWKAAQITLAELVAGDYLEFGVFRGESFIQAFRTIQEACLSRSRYDPRVRSPKNSDAVLTIWKNMRFFAFDSFRGLPEPGPLDSRSEDFTEGMYASTEDEFLDNLKLHAVDTSKVVTVPGWFEVTCQQQTIVSHRMKSAAIVHIDCDLYESARIALKFIEPLLVDGTVLIFDDWYCFRGNPSLGEQRAFREWTADKANWTFTQFQKEGSSRNSFIVSRTTV